MISATRTTKIPFSRELEKDVYDEEMQRAWSLDDHVYKETSIESAKKDLDEWFGVEFAKVREQHEMAMLDKWQGLDSRMEKKYATITTLCSRPLLKQYANAKGKIKYQKRSEKRE